jgi:DNA-binding MarR family transcriptional regulator
VSFRPEYDDRVIELLALGNALNTTKIAKHLKVDDGALTLRLFELAKEDLIRVCGADGSTPVWELTDAGRARREQRRWQQINGPLPGAALFARWGKDFNRTGPEPMCGPSSPRYLSHPRESASLSAQVRKERREARAGLSQAVGRGARGKTPLDALRSLLEADQDRYAAGIAAMLERGDPRALSLVERLFTADVQVEEPTDLDKLDDLTREQRRALYRKLVNEGRP